MTVEWVHAVQAELASIADRLEAADAALRAAWLDRAS
jgi:hypothetical protein